MKQCSVKFVGSETINVLRVEDIDELLKHLDRLRERVLQERSVHQSKRVGQAALCKIVKDAIRLRRRREALFGSGLFADPAWDILLELWVAEHQQTKLSVSSICHVSAVPPTTALRWLERLERDGWVTRSADVRDGRRWWLALTDAGRDAFETLFAGVSTGPF